MKINRNGFTLIELLAVIVILAIIALIATPVIISVLNDARQSSAVDSTYGIIKAGEYFFAQQLLANPDSGMSTAVTFTFGTDQAITSSPSGHTLDVKGTRPTSGTVTVATDGTVSATGLKYGAYTCSTSGSVASCS